MNQALHKTGCSFSPLYISIRIESLGGLTCLLRSAGMVEVDFFPPHSVSAALHGLIYSSEILSFLLTAQHTRWDSSARTVTQAFRHSLARTNTISVTFHYMVQGWISGLETHQISTQGVLPPHPRYCLSATMWNCSLFALFLPEI